MVKAAKGGADLMRTNPVCGSAGASWGGVATGTGCDGGGGRCGTGRWISIWCGRTQVVVYLDTGQTAWLRAPYHGRLLASDPGFERKLFMLRNLWETHRTFAIEHDHPRADSR